MKDNSKTGDWGYKMESEGFKKLPQFIYNPSTLDEILRDNLLNVFILLIWLGLPLGLLILSAKKL